MTKLLGTDAEEPMMGRWLVLGKLHRDGGPKPGGTMTRRARLEWSQVRAKGPVKAELLPKAGERGTRNQTGAGGGWAGRGRIGQLETWAEAVQRYLGSEIRCLHGLDGPRAQRGVKVGLLAEG